MGNCLSKKAQSRQLGGFSSENQKNTSNPSNTNGTPNRELAAKAAEERIKANESRGTVQGGGSMSMKLSQSRRNSKPIIPPIDKSEPLVVSRDVMHS